MCWQAGFSRRRLLALAVAGNMTNGLLNGRPPRAEVPGLLRRPLQWGYPGRHYIY
jgi:hypothetical protein